MHSTYGALPGHAELRAEGQRHSWKRIARLMRAARPVDVSRSDLGQAREAVGVFYDRPLDWSPTMFRNLTINQAA